VLGSNLAGVPVKKPAKDAPVIAHVLARSHVDLKALKMAVYGFLVSAPLGHYLVGALQKGFAGKTGTSARIGQILASNLLVAPIQTVGRCSSPYHSWIDCDFSDCLAFLSSMAIISGAKTTADIVSTVKAGFFSVIRVRDF
jgi:peroxisomal membrane protein 2